MLKDNVQVVIRVRPLNEREKCKFKIIIWELNIGLQSLGKCFSVENSSRILMGEKPFNFDYVAEE